MLSGANCDTGIAGAMRFEFTWVDPLLVICRMSGAATPEDFVVSTQAMISNPRFTLGMDRVADLTELDASALTSGDIEQIAVTQAPYVDEIGPGRLVLVTGHSSLTFGLSRMFEMYFNVDAGASLLVFETVDEALAYLRPNE
jgi:hypothetical protein